MPDIETHPPKVPAGLPGGSSPAPKMAKASWLSRAWAALRRIFGA